MLSRRAGLSASAGLHCSQARPLFNLYLLSCSLVVIEFVISAKLLGVAFSQTCLLMSNVCSILTIQRLYLLKCLKSQELPQKQLHVVFSVIILTRNMYPLPAWRGILAEF